MTLTILIVLQTWLSPFQGWLVDRFGPRLLVAAGGLLSGLGWVLSAHATSLTALYLTYGVLCGVGTGIVYIGIIGLMVRWFPDRRGFAVGMVAAGYGFGAILTTFPIEAMLKTSGYQHDAGDLRHHLRASSASLAALGLRAPSRERQVTARSPRIVDQQARLPRRRQMLRTPIFWLMFVMMTMMSTGGLMVSSQFAAFTRDFGIADVLVFGTGGAAARAHLRPHHQRADAAVLRLGLRPYRPREHDGDRLHPRRHRDRALAADYRDQPAAVRHPVGLVFFGWGEIFSLFPSTLTDTFGTKHATTNYGFLYMAQGIGSVLGGPTAAFMHDKAGSWVPVFLTVAALDILTGLLALFVLKKMRAKLLN